MVEGRFRGPGSGKGGRARSGQGRPLSLLRSVNWGLPPTVKYLCCSCVAHKSVTDNYVLL